jgi:hypothetical protein
MQHARLKGVDLHQDSLTVARPHSACQARLRSRYTTRRSPDWLKSKNPACEAVKREAKEEGTPPLPFVAANSVRGRHSEEGVSPPSGHFGLAPGRSPSSLFCGVLSSRLAEQSSFAAMLEDAIFWIAIAATVAGLVAVAVSIARG